MAQHILRKDLKKDEIREKFVHGVESVASHQQIMWVVAGAALVVALAVFGWGSYSRRQTAKANASLDDGMKIFQARIRAATGPALISAWRACSSRTATHFVRETRPEDQKSRPNPTDLRWSQPRPRSLAPRA